MYAKVSTQTLRDIATAKALLAAAFNAAADQAGEDPETGGDLRQNARDAQGSHNAFTRMADKRNR